MLHCNNVCGIKKLLLSYNVILSSPEQNNLFVSGTADMLAHYFCISALKVYELDGHITAS
jgi:glycerol dehydrogenase-like iron-containing ADH family enzyme